VFTRKQITALPKKNVNDVFVTTKENLATTYIEGRRQERAFSSQFAGRRPASGVNRVAVLVIVAQGFFSFL
jgi:hypothetical protein